MSNLTRDLNYNLFVRLGPVKLKKFAGTETSVKSVGLVDLVKPVAFGGPVDDGGPSAIGGPVELARAGGSPKASGTRSCRWLFKNR